MKRATRTRCAWALVSHAPATFFVLALPWAFLLGPSAAHAFYGNGASGGDGAELISADYVRLEQGDDTSDYAAISGNGRYVAIQTRARNFFADDDPDPPGRYRAGGIFRFDLQAKVIEKVADGSVFDEETNALVRLGALRPSISADGRYVAFTTVQRLVPLDTNESFDVYVRDMSQPLTSPGAFDLVSARDGGDVPAHYGPPAFPFPGNEPGADVSRGVAISGDGKKVVFRTDAPSDLPAAASPDVPAGQVFLRDRAADTTTLVSAKRDSGSGEMTTQPAGGATGAALSADGTTVAWTAGNAASQVPLFAAENASPGILHYLWRRVADGTTAKTRRITGLADPDDPACLFPPPSFDRVSTGPCYGPLTEQEGIPADIGSQVPVLSGDGYTIAFLTGAAARPLIAANPGLDLFVTDMHPGLSRKQSTVELTRDTLDNDIATASPLSSVAISTDGRYLAIATSRTRFTLPALQLLTAPRLVPGSREIYVADLQSRTLERVTHSYSGGDIDAGAIEGATLSAGGERVAFAAFAGNLFFGDANQRADAFVVTRQPDPEGGAPEEGLAEGGLAGSIEVDRDGPRIGARAKSKAAGKIVVSVSVPAAGGVKVAAKANAGTPRKPRTLATASGRARGAGRSIVRLVLEPVARYRAELRKRGTIRGRALVTYVASRGGRRASTSLRIAFVQVPVKGKKAGRGVGR